MTSWSLAVRFTNPYQFHFTLWNFNFTNYIYQFNFQHLSYKTPFHLMKPTTFAHLSHHSTFKKSSPETSCYMQSFHLFLRIKLPILPFFGRVLYIYILICGFNMFNHFETKARQIGSFSQVGTKQKLKPPTSMFLDDEKIPSRTHISSVSPDAGSS